MTGSMILVVCHTCLWRSRINDMYPENIMIDDTSIEITHVYIYLYTI
jgi:hypothetical protein